MKSVFEKHADFVIRGDHFWSSNRSPASTKRKTGLLRKRPSQNQDGDLDPGVPGWVDRMGSEGGRQTGQ